MLEHFLRLARNSLGYLAASVIPAFLGVLLLPLYTRFLTPDDYGITATAASIAAFLTAFYQLGLLAAYGRFYFDYRHDVTELKRHISTIAIFLGLHGLLLTIIITTLLNGPFERLLPGVPFSPHIQIAIWSGYFQLIFMLRLNLYRTEMRAYRFLALSVAHVATTAVLTILFVVVLRQGALGYLTAMLIANGVFSGVSLCLLRQYLIPVVDRAKLKAGLRYGLPLIPHIVGLWMFQTVDRLMLTSMVNSAETGLYSVGFAVSQAVTLVASAVNYAWSPFFYAQMKDRGDDAKPEVARFVTYWVLAMSFAFLLTSGFSRELVTVLAASSYRQAYHVVTPVALGLLFGGFYFVVVNPLFWLRRTPLIATATLSSGVLNIVLNLLFIPTMQMIGAAVATALSNLFCLLFIAFFSLRLFPVAYEFRRLVKIGVATAFCSLLFYLAEYLGGFWVVVLAKLAIVPLFPTALVALQFPVDDERGTVRSWLAACVVYIKHSLVKGHKTS